MAEVINIAPGIAGLLSLTTEVFNISSDFSNVHRANEAANSLLQELQSLRRVLAQLKELTDKDEEGGLLESNSSLILASEDIGLCRATLKNIQKNLEKHPDTSEQYGRVKSLTWPFSEERTQEITCMLHRHFSLFQSALNADAFPSGTETLNEIRGNQLENSGENHPEGLDWLSRINVRQRHHDISSRRQDGTGRWLLEDIVINDWLEANNSTRVVWCPGDPGTGKTVMTSLLIDYIESKNDTEDVGIAFMYFDFQDPKMQTASEIIASLVHQLAKRTKHLPRDLRDLYGELKDGLGQPQFNPLLAVLKSLCNNFKQTYIILDALDEFGDLGEREILLSSLIPLTQGSLKLLATSRPNHVDLKLQFDNVPQVEIRAPEDDIRNYARERMGADQDFTRQITPSLEEQIINTVAQRASGMFLMAVLQLELVCAQRTVTSVLDSLQSLPSKLEDTYLETLERIKRQQRDNGFLAMRVLHWLIYAKRSLRVHELCHALAIEWDDEEEEEEEEEKPLSREKENLMEPGKIVDVCAGLVIIEPESGIVRLVHPTTDEFLRSRRESLFPNAESDICGTCLACLSFDSLGRYLLSEYNAYHEIMLQYPLFPYASSFWSSHLRGEREWIHQKIALSFIYKPWFLQAVLLNHTMRGFQMITSSSSILHVVATLGMEFLLSLVLDKKVPVDERDENLRTPLHLAAKVGETGVVRLLLTNNAWIDACDKNGYTPLLFAVESGEMEVVRLLLDRGADADILCFGGWSAFHQALYWRSRKQEPIGMWKGGSEVNAQVSCGYTALHYAVWRRNEEMVQVLLDYHADYATADTRGMRALHYCVDSIGFRSGKCDIVQAERVLRLLLDKGAGLEVKDQGGRNVFQYAVRNGPESMMRLLLDSGANCKARDDVGRTPLHYSAFYTGGSRNQPQWLEIESVLLLLLDRGADLEAKDIKGKTVLRYALERKFDLMVRLLLENGADYRMTLSHSAALESYVGKFLLKRKEIEVAVLLLLDKEVDLEAKGKSGEIVLPYAVERGFEFLVKLLLREGAAYHVKAASQRTLMHRDAIRSSQSERPEVKDERDVVAKLLLDKPFDLEDEAEIIAFHSAAARGLEGLVGIFLDRRACPDFKGGHRVTAFRRTLLEGHEGVLGTLRVDPSRSRNERQMDNEASVRLISEGSRSSEAEVARSWIILHDAALQGHKRLALLMKYRGINLSAKFELGWTALIFASWAGSEEAVRLLLDGRVDVNAKDDDGYTALHYAAENNVEPVARLLCRGGAELNAKTLFTGNSALHLAVQGKDQVKRRLDWSQKTDVGGDQDVAKDEQSRGAADESRARADRKQELLLQLLLERGSDINSTNRRGQTPLHITAERGADRLVILLLDAGAKIDAATGDGETPLDLAMMNGHALTTKLLLERGAKAGNGNGTGWNTADWDDGEELDLVVVLQRLSAPRE